MNPFDSLYGTLAVLGGGYLVVRLAMFVYRSAQDEREYWSSRTAEQLEEMLFTLHEPYFSKIGRDHRSVTEFRVLVEARDLQALSQRWPAIERDFLALERSSGHRGRPLLLDYYFHYVKAAKELQKRLPRNES